MARDYSGKRGNGRRPSQGRGKPASRARKPGTPGWVWLLCGLTVGLLLAIGVFIFTRPTGGHTRLVDQPLPPSRTAKQAPVESATMPKGKPAPAPKQQPRFSFYDMLPNYKIVIPQKKYRSPEQKANPTVDNPGQYLIQVASFRDYADADHMKAKLALLGIESDIKKATISNGQTWYRVRIGPSQDTSKLNHILGLLQSHSIDSLVMRVSSNS